MSVDDIGRTPWLDLSALVGRPGTLYAKDEACNPGGSIKDRAARGFITQGRLSGRLAPGQPVVEATSGNLGRSLAWICRALGHPFTAVVSSGQHSRRIEALREAGARVEIVDQVTGRPGEVTGSDLKAADARARVLARELGAWHPRQFTNTSIRAEHREGLAREIMMDLGAAPAAFLACVGSGGTFAGVVAALRDDAPAVVGLAVEPAEAPALTRWGAAPGRHGISGVGFGVVPPLMKRQLVSEVLAVNAAEVSEGMALLAGLGLDRGPSSGANIAAAMRYLKAGGTGPVVTILCDHGRGYRVP